MFVYSEGNPINFIDSSGLQTDAGHLNWMSSMMSVNYDSPGQPKKIPLPSHQTLKTISLYSAPFAAGSFITGNTTSFLIFSSIGLGAETLDIALYSDFKTIDYIKNAIKQLDPLPPPFDFLSKEIIDRGFDYYMNDDKNDCP